MTDQEKLDRAAEAERIINNPALIAAKQKILESIGYLRAEVPPRDLDGAMRLVQMEQTVLKTFQHLNSFIQDAEQARKKLEKEVTPIHRRMLQRYRG